MRKVIVVGTGRIGATIAEWLSGDARFAVTAVDRSQAALAGLDPHAPLARAVVDIAEPAALDAALEGAFAVVSAAPFHLTARVAGSAARCGAHYLDLTEDVAATRLVRALAADARSAFLPQCGLAPGFIAIVAHDLAQRFDSLLDLKLRVGALPQFPSNALAYNLTWSTEGVINEYCEPCEAIVDGQLRGTAALEEREEFVIDGVAYEAFNTSGGLGSLCETYAGRARNLDYRTIRYPGHAAIMKTLLNDLRLRERRAVLKDILEHAIPTTQQDVVVIFVTATGLKSGRLTQESWAARIYAQTVEGRPRSAIQATTAAGVCGALDLLAEGRLPQRGLVRQEDIRLADFLATRYGRLYAPAAARPLAA